MAPPRLLFLVTEDWYFLLHRLPTARAAQAAGYEVHVATRVNSGAAAIKREGFHLHPLDWERGSVNPARFASSVLAVRRLYRGVAPTVVHHVALQALVVGLLAASRLPVATVSSMVGLGYVFTSREVKARVVRAAIARALPILANRPRSAVVVENPDDRRLLANLGIRDDRIHVIGGSVLDLDRVAVLPEPPEPITVAFVGRMLADKGVRTLLAAHRILAERGTPVRLLLAGEPDPANPTSLSRAEIEGLGADPTISWLGHVADVGTIWARAHIAVLPSRREGLPQSLIEAAAFGRPLVATDVPGCREVAQHEVNGLLVPPDDADALASAIARLAGNAEMRARFGEAGRRLVETRFSPKVVAREMIALYGRLAQEAMT